MKLRQKEIVRMKRGAIQILEVREGGYLGRDRSIELFFSKATTMSGWRRMEKIQLNDPSILTNHPFPLAMLRHWKAWESERKRKRKRKRKETETIRATPSHIFKTWERKPKKTECFALSMISRERIRIIFPSAQVWKWQGSSWAREEVEKANSGVGGTGTKREKVKCNLRATPAKNVEWWMR